jgi:hypothetical protein
MTGSGCKKNRGASMRKSSSCLVMFLFSVVFVSACASPERKDLLRTLRERPAPEVRLGPEITILDQQPSLITLFVAKNGRVHVFAVDRKKDIRHIEIEEQIVANEVIGKLDQENSHPRSLDAVEHPEGTIRVLAGNSQFVRGSRDQPWHEIKGNLCDRFAVAGDDLYCTFIAKGEQIGAPKRTDWVIGWFILVPVAWPSQNSAAKLVLARERDEGWQIQAILDADTLEDAHGDYMVGTDGLNNLHFLYAQSKGGWFFWVIAAPMAGGTAGSSEPTANLRYAFVPFTSLSPIPEEKGALTTNEGQTAKQPLKIEGVSLPLPGYAPIAQQVRPLNRKFLVKKDSVIFGLIQGGFKVGDDWLATEIQDGRWCIKPEVVAMTGMLDLGSGWDFDDNEIIKANPAGKVFVLIEAMKGGFWSPSYAMTCLIADHGRWSAPIVLGSSKRSPPFLAVDGSGGAFAAWMNTGGKLVGRWIRGST